MKINTIENKLLLACHEVLVDLAQGIKEYPPIEGDDITVLAFDNEYLSQVLVLTEKLTAWKKGELYEN